jgi:hypothetical protein
MIMALLGGGGALAKECRGVSFPEQTQVEGSTLTLNGLGVRKATMLKVSVYVGALYVAKTSDNPNTIIASNLPTELVLQFVRDVGANDVRDGWSEGLAKSAKSQLPALQDRITMLNGWMANVKAGQRMAFTFKPGVGVQVDVNGATKGTIKGDDFATFCRSGSEQNRRIPNSRWVCLAALADRVPDC